MAASLMTSWMCITALPALAVQTNDSNAMQQLCTATANSLVANPCPVLLQLLLTGCKDILDILDLETDTSLGELLCKELLRLTLRKDLAEDAHTRITRFVFAVEPSSNWRRKFHTGLLVRVLDQAKNFQLSLASEQDFKNAEKFFANLRAAVQGSTSPGLTACLLTCSTERSVHVESLVSLSEEELEREFSSVLRSDKATSISALLSRVSRLSVPPSTRVRFFSVMGSICINCFHLLGTKILSFLLATLAKEGDATRGALLAIVWDVCTVWPIQTEELLTCDGVLGMELVSEDKNMRRISFLSACKLICDCTSVDRSNIAGLLGASLLSRKSVSYSITNHIRSKATTAGSKKRKAAESRRNNEGIEVIGFCVSDLGEDDRYDAIAFASALCSILQSSEAVLSLQLIVEEVLLSILLFYTPAANGAAFCVKQTCCAVRLTLDLVILALDKLEDCDVMGTIEAVLTPQALASVHAKWSTLNEADSTEEQLEEMIGMVIASLRESREA